jgi:uncharacterized pyridoxal phosphate-containing UPF0001 family protein
MQQCETVDSINESSYAELESRYRNETARLVFLIGIVVGNESRRAGLNKEKLFETVDRLTGIIVAETQNMAKANRQEFVDLCRALPAQAASKIGPFEPLNQKFPNEIKILYDLMPKG